MPKPDIKYFISYAHNDNAFFQVFKKGINTHLHNSGRYNFTAWDDSEIPGGSQWHEEIQGNLSRSQLAILCVSGNFLNSEYIRTNEFKVLMEKFPDIIIIPVYFSSCDFTGWQNLARIQFFKPDGALYDKAGTIDFCFCDLVKFNSDNGLPIPNSNLEKYFKDFVTKVEKTISGKDSTPQNEEPADKNNPPNEQGKPGSDKLAAHIFVAVMALSAAFVLFCLLFQKMNTEGMFKSSLGSVMFFFSGALFLKNKNSIAV
jgi:hypothetical protein